MYNVDKQGLSFVLGVLKYKKFVYDNLRIRTKTSFEGPEANKNLIWSLQRKVYQSNCTWIIKINIESS